MKKAPRATFTMNLSNDAAQGLRISAVNIFVYF